MNDAIRLDEGPRPTRVLLAEDDPNLRFGLSRWLEWGGFEVQSVPDGAALLDRITTTLLDDEPTGDAPDLIVTDLRMPGFNALNLLEGLRQEGWLTPVIVVTAFGDREVQERIAALGRASFLPKPVDLSQFEQLVARASA